MKVTPAGVVGDTFNRTSMELKHVHGYYLCHSLKTFNRTSMELKLGHQTLYYQINLRLLIEPVWN